MIYLWCMLGVLASLLSIATYFLFRYRSQLVRFRDIAEPEAYRIQCVAEAQKAVAEAEHAKLLKEAVVADTNNLKKQVQQYQTVVKNFKSAAELQNYVKQLSKWAEGCKTIAELNAKAQHHQQLIAQLIEDAHQLGFAVRSARDAGDINEQVVAKRRELDMLKKAILDVEEVKELHEFGFYKRHYNFDSSDSYKRKLDEIKALQKGMIKKKTAATCNTEWVVEGSKAKGRKMINDKIKLLLRAFNGETDAAIAKVTFSNATSMEGRISKSFESINKMGEVNQVRIERHYLDLKLQELYLTHEFKVQKEEEKAEQRQIKQMMKEEAKVEQELRRAQQDAERDEELKREALERARAELRTKEGRHTEKLGQLVQKLELELQEALDRKAKAIARAQLTKSGHVYVLSNIGSFGENVYKIGMTRRLEPLERVSELGSASVPFLFDVHAMIYSENAPELETKLHRHFASRRVNVINMRKEFFRVSLEEIREAVAEHFGVVTFTLESEAAEFRQTLAYHADAEARKNGDRVGHEMVSPYAAAVGV